VASEVGRGEIWLLDLAPPDKRQPVLVLSRPVLLRVLHTVTVAAITSTRRGSPTEVPIGHEEGLKHSSAVNLSNLFTVPRARLRRYVGVLRREKMREVCRALVLACGCDEAI
jgi:mRNA interferase MazF